MAAAQCPVLSVSAADTLVSVSGSCRQHSADAAVSLSDRAGTVVGKAAGSEVEADSRPSDQRRPGHNCRHVFQRDGT